MSRVAPLHTDVEWRRRWRALGLAVDRLLPLAYKSSAPLVPAYVNVSADRKVTLSDVDRALVAEAVDFAQNFIAELPVQVALTDFKGVEADCVSDLAVKPLAMASMSMLGLSICCCAFVARAARYGSRTMVKRLPST